MSHPLVLALYPSAAAASLGAQALHEAGVTRDQISVITRNHDEDTALAKAIDASPGVEIEDSRVAARLGELSGHVLAAIAIVLPGIGPIVAAGPLAADLGEAAGHAAGGVASALSGAGLSTERAEALEHAVRHDGAVLLAVHTTEAEVPAVRSALQATSAGEVDLANWSE
ncbi:MAG: hypothetical protein ABI818_11015 [Acidobacteriota bacterium]